MKNIYKLGIFALMLVFLSATALADDINETDENETDEDECLVDTDCDADEFCDAGECEGLEEDENETDEDEDETNETGRGKGKNKDKSNKGKGKKTTNDTNETDETNETVGKPKKVPPGQAKKLGNQTKLTGIQRAIQVITRAQERLAERGKVAPGHAVALSRLGQKLLDIATNLTEEAGNTTDNETADKLARDAERLANQTGEMNETEMEGIVNESRGRKRAKKLKLKLKDLDLNETELEDLLNETANVSQLRAEIKAMNKEFRAIVKGLLTNGTQEEKQQLKEQFMELKQERAELKLSIRLQRLNRNQIRKLLGEDETVEEIAEAV